MTTSLARSTSVRWPRSSKRPRSPVCSQPPRSVCGRLLGHVEVAGHHGRPVDHDLAHLAGRQLAVVLVDARARASPTRATPTERSRSSSPASTAAAIAALPSAVIVHGRLALAVAVPDAPGRARRPRRADRSGSTGAAPHDHVPIRSTGVERRLRRGGTAGAAGSAGRRSVERSPAAISSKQLVRVEAAGGRQHLGGAATEEGQATSAPRRGCSAATWMIESRGDERR